jgi:hypothetical protein
MAIRQEPRHLAISYHRDRVRSWPPPTEEARLETAAVAAVSTKSTGKGSVSSYLNVKIDSQAPCLVWHMRSAASAAWNFFAGRRTWIAGRRHRRVGASAKASKSLPFASSPRSFGAGQCPPNSCNTIPQRASRRSLHVKAGSISFLAAHRLHPGGREIRGGRAVR